MGRGVRARLVAVVVVLSVVLSGVPLVGVTAAPVPVPVPVDGSVGQPGRIDPGVSSYVVPGAAPYRVHEVVTPVVVSSVVSAGGDVAARVDGLPVSVRAMFGADVGSVSPVDVRVQSLDADTVAALGGQVLAFGVNPVDVGVSATVEVSVDYSAFRFALGADWAQRLQLTVWDCSPDMARSAVKSCGDGVALEGVRNDLVAGSLTATVSVGGLRVVGGGGKARVMVFASGATLGLTTSSGSFAATSLSSTGTWQVRGNTGSFSYSYPVVTPPAFNGLGPSVSLEYDSAVVDAVTTDANAQASEVGQGWTLAAGQGFIERRYLSCKSSLIAGNAGSSDACWYAQNGTISLNGHSSELVPVNGTANVEDSFTLFRLKDDPGWLVQRFNSPSGDWWASEYWTVTTPEGVVYRFGLNDQGQNSRLVRPVRGWSAGEPCYGWANRLCSNMAYRWMLDSVTDPFGNTMVYRYELQKNSARTLGSSAYTQQYDAGALLSEIDYGKAPAAGISGFRDRVVFSYIRRCVQAQTTGSDADCPAVSNANGGSYPDVPTDLYCQVGPCTKDVSFFNTKRLVSITTQTSSDGVSWASVSRWRTLVAFPAPQDATNEKLQLWAISRVNPANDVPLLPGSYFGWTDFRNREDAAPLSGVPYLFQFRVSTVIDDLGRRSDVTYTTVPCPKPWGWSTNTTDCHPAPDGAFFGIFRRYAVDKVVVSDMVTGAAGQTGTSVAPTVTYDYVWGAAAWHVDSLDWWNAVRSWGEFRGYSSMWTLVGSGATKNSTYETFYTGMNGDATSSGGTKSVSLARGWTTTSEGYTGTIWDDDWLAGQVYETRHGFELWVSQTGASRNYFLWSVAGTDGVSSRTGVAAKQTRKFRQTLQHTISRDGTSAVPVWRETRTDTSIDSLGRVTGVHSSGFLDVSGDESCARTFYITGSGPPSTGSPGWMNLVAQTAQYATVGVLPTQSPYTAGACSGSQPTKVDKVFYNNNTYATGAVAESALSQPLAAGFKPVATASMSRTKNFDSVTDALDRWVYRTATFDAAGRVTSTTDANGNQTGFGFDASYGYANTASYPSVAGVTLTTSSVLRPGDGLAATTTDQNSQVTNYCYDALSRLTAGFLARLDGTTRSGDPCAPLLANPRPATADTPNVEYIYDVGAIVGFLQSKLPTIVVTSTLQSGTTLGNDVRVESAAYLDGLGHTRETQTWSPTTGKVIVTANLFDDRNNLSTAIEAFTVTDTAPGDRTSPTAGGSLGLATWPNLPTTVTLRTDTTVYDILNRPLSATRKNGATTLVANSIEYRGSQTITKPQIGSWVATSVDGRGRTIKVAAYNGTTAPTTQGVIGDGAAITTYAYNFDQTANSVGGYDKAGWLTTVVTDDGLNSTSTVSDLAGRTISGSDPDAGASQFSYDGNGNVTRTVDAAGNTINTGYDALNRPVGRWAGTASTLSAATATDRLASWTYDATAVAFGRGMMASETSWQTGQQYTTTVAAYSPHYRPLSTKVTIPGTFGVDLLAGDWQFQSVFDEAGHTLSVSTPSVPTGAGVSDPQFATTTTHYDGLGQPDQLFAGASPVDGSRYVTGTTFDDLGRVTDRMLSRTSATNIAGFHRSYSYDTATGAVATIKGGWKLSGADTWFQTDTYSRDAIGNVTQILDSGVEASGAGSNVKECFLYDQWNRLVRAHSGAPATACAASTAAATVATGSRDPYDNVWTFDDINRTTSRTDRLAGTAATAFNYPTSGGVRPHALSSATGGGAAGGYGYNAFGAMSSRDTNTADATPAVTIGYDTQQRLSSYGTIETYLYGTGNQRLIRTAGTTRTLYLPGIEVTATSTTRAVTRFVSIGGAQIATIAPNGSVAWNCASAQQSTVCQAPAATTVGVVPAAPARKRYLPYGDDRNAVAFTGTDHRFLGQPDDTTGLTYLNNRYYDPTVGVFVSVDPLVGRTGTPYLYGAGNPSTFSDPNGLCAHNNGRQGYDDGKGDCVRKGYPGGSTSACWGAAETPQYCVSTPGTKADFADGLMRRWDENWNKTESERAEYFLTLMGGDPGNLDFAFEMARNRNLTDYWMHHPDEALSMGTWRPAMAAMWAAGALYIAEGAGNQGSSSSSACHSFDPRTEVVMADGTRKHIAEVKVGDYVLTTDPVTGVLMMRRVTELHINHDTDLADVVVADAKGQQATLHTTQRHMFWDDTRGAWTEAGELRPGDRLHDLVGGLVTVVGVHDYAGARKMYDLTVGGVHTYYVEAGDNAVLVHNCGWGDPATLEDHFARHGGDFGAPTASAYVDLADDFYASRGQYLTKTTGGPNPVTRVYDPASNTFGSYNADGSIKTFYKPDPAVHGYATNWDYWLAQGGT
ncbi:unannotated protein [freshwater metagenome]|uniref:Unannotated protein n=2 Tax=freshwater metagenome TaxID=449393 RepID=A0A6J7I0Y4_9ZZZZ